MQLILVVLVNKSSLSRGRLATPVELPAILRYKNCDRGHLENAARGRGRTPIGQPFQARGHSFSPYGPTQAKARLANSVFVFSCGNLVYY